MLICFCLTMNGLWAANINETTNSIKLSDNTPETVSNSNADSQFDKLRVDDSLNVTKADLGSNDVGDEEEKKVYSFTDFGKLIKYTPDHLVLDGDIIYNSSIDGDGLVISKNNYVIDFNGHSIDANGHVGTLLTVSGNNVVFKNLKFINGKGTYSSKRITEAGKTYTSYSAVNYPILWSGDNGVINLSEFTSSETVLKWTGSNGLINNSYFHDSKYEQIYAGNDHFVLQNTLFERLSGLHSSDYVNGHTGFHVNLAGESKVMYCNFSDISEASLTGGYTVLSNSNFFKTHGIVRVARASYCIFDSVYRPYQHVYANQPHYLSAGTIEFCTFQNFSISTSYHCSITPCGIGTVIRNCTFINNKVPGLFREALGGIFNSTFINNVIYEYTLGYNTKSSYTNAYFNGCTFINNNFRPGYVISCWGNVRIFNCQFFNNTAKNELFYVNTGSTLFIKNSNFSTNNVFNGWAVKLSNSNQNLVFLDNLSNFYNENPISPTSYNNETFLHIYVNQTGGGDGLSPDSPTTISDAVSKIAFDGVIEFINNGQVYNLNVPVINKRITFIGNNITFSYSGTVFDVRADYVNIFGFNFIKCGNSGATTIKYFRPDKDGIVFNYLTIKDCNFINNIGQIAGCIQTHHKDQQWYFGGNNLLVDNCTFINNTASTYMNQNGWTENGYRTGGYASAGAIHVFSGATIVNCIFEGNTAPTGGAVSFDYACKAVVENCIFRNNHATTLSAVSNNGRGGFQTAGAIVMHAVNTKLSYIKNCTFEDNYAPMAGAIFAQGVEDLPYGQPSKGKISITDCTFTNNTAVGGNGGAVYLYSDDANVVNCIFNQNNANNGGAIYLNGNKINIINSLFIANFANHDCTIFLSPNTKGTVNIIDSNFTQMNAPINFLMYDVNIDKSLFYNNANGTLFGNYDTTTLTISNTIFTNNSGSVNGSAIYYRGYTNINASSFINNSASAYGGALYLTQEQCRITYSEFRGNIAVDGGAVCMCGDELYVGDCVFTNNNATHSNTLGGGGAIFVDGNFVQLYNSIFQYNYATYYGGAIFINGTNRFYAVNSKVRINFNDTNYCNGPDPRVGKYDVELPAFNPMKIDKEFNYHNIYEYAAMELIEEVYVLKYPTAIPNNNFTGDRQNPVTFHDALQMVAPNGKIIFINSSEVYTQFHDGTPYGGSQLTFTRGFSIIGNDTTIVNLRFLIDQDNFKIYNIKFTGCNDSVVIFDGYNGHVENCTFSDNCIPESVVGGYGLGMVVLKENMTIINTKFINNAIESNDDVGGALFINASNIVVNNCTFKNNTGHVSHLYICEGLETITIRNSVFKDGGKVDAGGVGILLNSMNNIKILNCNFTNISATQGGAIRINGVFFMLNLNGNIFAGNSAEDGGAVYITIKSGSDLINLNRNIYNDNTATNNGGALYINSTYRNIVISNSNFTANKATINGGAIFMTSTTTVSASNFISNVADRGGAIYIGATGVRIRDSNFTYNNATLGSAIFHASKSQTALYNLYVAENHVFGEDTAGYGDICIDDAVFSIPNGDVVFNYFTGTPRYMNYIGNCSAFNLNVVYVTHNGTGLGTTSSTPTTLEKALIILVKINSTIVFCEDMDVSETLSNYTNLVVRSNVGRYYTLKRKEGKNIFIINDGSNITIQNLGLAGGVEVNSNNYLYLDNVTVSITDAESGGIVYKTSSFGEIFNSTFIDNKNLSHVLTINGKVNIDECSFINNNLAGAVVYYNSTGSGYINNSYFSNNSATIGVRNLNITNFNNVAVINNDFDAILSNAKISNDVYGENVVINGNFDVGVNFAVENITFILNNTFKTNKTLTVTKESVFSFNLNAGVLASGNYNIMAQNGNLKNIYSVKYTNNNFIVKRANVASNNLVITEVNYAINDTIKIKGYFNQTTAGIKYNGVVNITITNENATISNTTVEVINGEFVAILSDSGRLGVGKYDVIVSNNGQSNNENFTVSNYTFKNNFTVSKTNVAANYTVNVTVIYGMNYNIIVEGTFNASAGSFAKLYNGNITVTVTNNIYSITNASVVVRDGKFSAVLVDGGQLGVGLYNIIVSPNFQSTNYNYTVVENTFSNKVNVTKANVDVNNISDITVVYGVNKTICVSGKISNSTYGVKYNGFVNITITNGNRTINGYNILVVNGTFSGEIIDMGNLTSGKYNVTISSNYLNNYTVIPKTFTNNITVLKYDVYVLIEKVNITYGANTINIHGNVSNSIYGQLYNGFIDVVVGNHTYSNVEVLGGKFTVVVSDLSDYNVSVSNVSVNGVGLNENYIFNNISFKDYFIIRPAASSINISSITGRYDSVIVTPIISENITSLIVSVYTLDGQEVSDINITINSVDSVSIVGLNIGKYVINVTGIGDNNHIGCNVSSNITVIKATSKLTVENISVVYSSGNITVWYDVVNATITSFKVFDENNNPVSCTIIKYKYTFEINGLAAGNYTFNVIADGGVNYENASSISNITIKPAGSKVVVPVCVITYGEHGILNVSGENITGINTVTIFDANGQYVGNYNINNLTVDVWNLNSSEIYYRVIVTSDVDENHTASTGIGWVFVKKATSAISVPDNFNMTYGDVKTVTIELKNLTSEDIVQIYVVSNGEIINCDISQNGTDIFIGGLAVGDYALIVESRETTNYNASVGAGNFKVLHAGSSFSIPGETNMSHLGGNITIRDVVNATGVRVKLFDAVGNQINVSLVGYDIIFGRLDVGIYTLNVTTIIDSNHTSFSQISTVNVMKMLSPSIINITGITKGVYNTSNAVINFNIINRTQVSVLVFKNGTDICIYNNTDFKGDIFEIGNLISGFYNITISNAESDYFNSSSISVLFEIEKALSFVKIINVTDGAVNKTNATVSFDVLNMTTIKIIIVNLTGDVILTFNEFSGNFISIGNLTKGLYNITIINEETENYAEFSVSTTFKFTYKGSIIANGISRGYNSPYDYVAIFTDEVGIPLNNTLVQMTVGGQVYNVTTNDKGEAYLTETTLSVGLHNITLYNPITEEEETYTINIVERLQENNDIVMDFFDGTFYSVRAYGDDANPVSGVTVTITVNGVSYDVVTNQEGYALLKIRLNPKTYTITAEWKGCKINKVIVRQTLKAKSFKVKKSSNKFKYSASLKWSNGKPIVGKVITFKFKGKTYVVKTNKKGVATIKIKKSVLKKLKVGKKYSINITYRETDSGYTAVNTIIKTIKIKR